MIRRTLPLALATVTVALGLAACGGSDDNVAKERESVATPERAAAEAGEVKILLDKALANYREGDRTGATKQIEDAYLDHFEIVEGPLEKIDPELKESLEDAISGELKNAANDGIPVSQLAEKMAEVEADLDTAIIKLKS